MASALVDPSLKLDAGGGDNNNNNNNVSQQRTQSQSSDDTALLTTPNVFKKSSGPPKIEPEQPTIGCFVLINYEGVGMMRGEVTNISTLLNSSQLSSPITTLTIRFPLDDCSEEIEWPFTQPNERVISREEFDAFVDPLIQATQHSQFEVDENDIDSDEDKVNTSSESQHSKFVRQNKTLNDSANPHNHNSKQLHTGLTNDDDEIEENSSRSTQGTAHSSSNLSSELMNSSTFNEHLKRIIGSPNSQSLALSQTQTPTQTQTQPKSVEFRGVKKLFATR